MNIDKKGEEIIEVPALNVFDILEEKEVQKPEKHIEIRFSDPLLKAQNLTGFEAVSLKAVEIRVIQIFKNNVLQFFQENKLNGDSDLKKVGHLVYSGKVDLNPAQPGGLERWDLYKVNLAELFQIEQGTIYHVEFRMKKNTHCLIVAKKQRKLLWKKPQYNQKNLIITIGIIPVGIPIITISKDFSGISSIIRATSPIIIPIGLFRVIFLLPNWGLLPKKAATTRYFLPFRIYLGFVKK